MRPEREQVLENAIQAILNAGAFNNNGDFIIPRGFGALPIIEKAHKTIETEGKDHE